MLSELDDLIVLSCRMIRKLKKPTEGVLFGEDEAGMQRQLEVAHIERENYSKRVFFFHLGQNSKSSFSLSTDLRYSEKLVTKIEKF